MQRHPSVHHLCALQDTAWRRSSWDLCPRSKWPSPQKRPETAKVCIRQLQVAKFLHPPSRQEINKVLAVSHFAFMHVYITCISIPLMLPHGRTWLGLKSTGAIYKFALLHSSQMIHMTCSEGKGLPRTGTERKLCRKNNWIGEDWSHEGL